MNILIDTSPLHNANAIRGVGRYTFELLQALRRQHTSHNFLSSTESKEITSADVIHYPFFDLYFPTLPLFKKAPTIVTIHDVIPLLFPNQYRPGLRGRVAHLRQRLALSSVSQVITDSNASKRDIIDHLKIPSDKISVVYLGSSEDISRPNQAVLDEVRKKYELPKNFALYVGDINYNKNLPFLISVCKKFPKLTLVLVGKNVNNTKIPEGKGIQDAIVRYGIESRVRRLDQVSSSQEISAIYSLATFYIQPSLYEGFGLPVLEAFACKTPVVCSRAGSLPEVGGDACVYFHPVDPEDCAKAIEKVLKFSPKQRQALIKKGQDQFQKFSWDLAAKETIAVYESVGKKV